MEIRGTSKGEFVEIEIFAAQELSFFQWFDGWKLKKGFLRFFLGVTEKNTKKKLHFFYT